MVSRLFSLNSRWRPVGRGFVHPLITAASDRLPPISPYRFYSVVAATDDPEPVCTPCPPAHPSATLWPSAARQLPRYSSTALCIVHDTRHPIVLPPSLDRGAAPVPVAPVEFDTVDSDSESYSRWPPRGDSVY